MPAQPLLNPASAIRKPAQPQHHDCKNHKTVHGKPPKHTQFKKGQSGNPRGRPKGAKNSDTILEEVLNRKLTVRENGSTHEISLREAVIRKQAENGDEPERKPSPAIASLSEKEKKPQTGACAAWHLTKKKSPHPGGCGCSQLRTRLPISLVRPISLIGAIMQGFFPVNSENRDFEGLGAVREHEIQGMFPCIFLPTAANSLHSLLWR